MNENNYSRGYDITGWRVRFESDDCDEEDPTDYMYRGKIYKTHVLDICYHQQAKAIDNDTYAWTTYSEFCDETGSSPENVMTAFSEKYSNVRVHTHTFPSLKTCEWLTTTSPLTKKHVDIFALNYTTSKMEAYQSNFMCNHDAIDLKSLSRDTVVIGSDKNSFFLGFVERFSLFDEDDDRNNYSIGNLYANFDVHGLVTFMNSLHLKTVDVDNDAPLLSMNARRFTVISKEYEYVKKTM